MSKSDGVFIYIGTYASEVDARADYDVVKDLHAVGVGERNLRQRIRVGDRIPRRPFGDQRRSPKAVIVVTQKRGVGIELLNELREQPFAYPRRGERAGRLHLGDYPGDDAERTVRHGALHMWSKPPVSGVSPRCKYGQIHRAADAW